MSNIQSDRNLLAGILALQFCLVNRDQLIAAMGAWVLDKSKSLDELLIQQGGLTIEDRVQLNALVELHLQKHGNDPERSLAAVNDLYSVRQELAGLKDVDVTSSLMQILPANLPVADDFAATAHYSVGQDSSSGDRFRILRPHARGGLGEVSVALDTELNREVALKEIQLRYAADIDSRTRFIAEAEITGGLEHPSIVPVYGLGTYSDGRPFYAMRFIRGASLQEATTRYHDQNRNLTYTDRSLEFRNLLQQFIHVCHAIEYAHSRGVLHRDLKPSNIMLGKYGETLVVDWGLAKVLGSVEHTSTATELPLQPVSGSESAPTQYGSTIGTPAFMSPEQATGELDKLGPATDVYGLGATLYYMLTCKPPVEGKDVGEVLRKVQAGDIIPPRHLQPSVAPALEAICLRAMALNRHQRYASAKSLALDIERWLADEPIEAYHDTLTERTFRWIRRNRSWAIAGSVAILLVSLTAGTSAVQIARERDEAQLARNSAETRLTQAMQSIDTWLVSAADAMRFYPSVQETRRQLLERAARDYESLTANKHEPQSLVHCTAHALNQLGDVHRLLGNNDIAESTYKRAIAKLNDAIREDAQLTKARWELVDSHLRMADLYNRQSNPASALVAFAEAESELSKIDHPSSSSRKIVAQSQIIAGRARLLADSGKHREAAIEDESAIQLLAGLSQDFNPNIATDRLQIQQHLATQLATIGQLRRAAMILREVRDAHTTMAADQQPSPDRLDAFAGCCIELANVCRSLGREDESVVAYEKARDIYCDLLRRMPDVPQFVESVAITRTDLGQLLFNTGELRVAQVELEASVKDLASLTTQFPGVPQYSEDLATAHATLGQVLRDLDKNADAELQLKSASSYLERLVIDYPEQVRFQERLALARLNLCVIRTKVSDTQGALMHVQESLRIASTLSKTNPESVVAKDLLAATHQRMSEVYRAMNDDARAESHTITAIKLREELLSTPELMAAFIRIASESKCDYADQIRSRTLNVAKRMQSKFPDFARREIWMSVAQFRCGNVNEAMASLDSIADQPLLHDGRYLLYLSMALIKNGDRDAGRSVLERADNWIRERRPGNPDLLRLQQEAHLLLK